MIDPRSKKKVCLVAGARPNFMKVAPIIRAIKKVPDQIEYFLVHTGQHYDREMSEVFFEQFGIPKPDYYLEANGGTHAEQTAKIMIAFEAVVKEAQPNLVLVVGDVNSTLACALVAKKAGVEVAHVEAGLRSGDWRMPEEINRVATDAISDLFFVTEPSGRANLLAEGKAEKAIHSVGHVMVDNLFFELEKLSEEGGVKRSIIDLKEKLSKYGILTLHRAENVDVSCILKRITSGIVDVSSRIPIIFPVHPRTANRMLIDGIKLPGRIHVLPPLSYRDLLYLVKDSSLVLTDSGGLQEETTALRIPCLTLRDNTERPITVTEGSNTLVGTDPGKIDEAVVNVLEKGGKRGQIPLLWDGKAAERIVYVLTNGEVN